MTTLTEAKRIKTILAAKRIFEVFAGGKKVDWDKPSVNGIDSDIFASADWQMAYAEAALADDAESRHG